MGLWHGVIKDLIELKKGGYIGPGCRIAEIGEQQLSDDFLTADDLLRELYAAFGRVRPREIARPVGIENFATAAPSSAPFWRSLGFGYYAFDIAGKDAIRLDLNRDWVSWRYRRSFDLIVNGGTTEHVANQANAFRVIHDLTKPGGIMLHVVPSQGMLTHGLVNYTMKFFWHLCRENRYEVLSLRFHVGVATPLGPGAAQFGIHFGVPQPPITFSVPECYILAILRKPNVGRHFAVPID